MNIKITEQVGELAEPSTWTLWVTEKPGDAEAPIHMATRRTPEQIQALLTVILAEKAPPAARPAPQPLRKVEQSQALYSMLTVLNECIQDARTNHVSMEHRNEGEECWRRWAPSDIRDMVNATARGLGISEFPISAVNLEDQPI